MSLLRLTVLAPMLLACGSSPSAAPSAVEDAGADAVLASDAASRPGPRTIDVDGRAVAIFQGGRGPSVVFESGLGDGYAPWQSVLEAVATRASVFAYDRAGYGGSAPSSAPRDGSTLVSELDRALAVANVAPPYVLVGHSLGGQLVQLFARLHPDRVRAVVLVDGRPAAFTQRCIAALGAPSCVLPDTAVATLPEPMRSEYVASDTTANELLQAPAFPRVLAIVLSRSKGAEGPAFLALWQQMQNEMAAELSASHTVVPDAGHYIQTDAPGAVIQAIP